MALFHANGAFADVNAAMTQLLGRSRQELLGRPISDFAPADWTDFVSHRTITALEEGASWHGEFPLVRPDGLWVYLQWSISAHLEPGLRIGIAVDVSERFELEARRLEVLEREQAARAAAERHSRTKDDFVAVLSHELRNPLTSIAGWLHILKRTRTPELLEKGLLAIERGVTAQTRIISDILDVSRINSGKLRLNAEWVDPAALVGTSIDALAASIAAKRLNVRFESSVAGEPAWIDSTRFQQVVWNLLTNAIKFSDADGRIDVDLRREGEMLTLSVRDFGRGIDLDFLPHLFDRFTQSDSPDSRQHGGLGLGLSIVRSIAELHGGTARASSEGRGRGATMTVTFRAVRPDPRSAGDVHDGEEPKPAAPDVALRGLDVLVVEDNADASEILTVVLSTDGAIVRLAPDFESAIDMIDAKWPDVVISDIGLPGRDGYELMRQIRAMQAAQGRPSPFAVALSAFSRPADKSKALEAGFDAHMAKPLQPHSLVAAIQRRSKLPG